MIKWIAFAFAATLAAVVAQASPRPVQPTRETIRYETGACFGACPIFTLAISPDGRGTFVGRRFTAAMGEHRFRATREQYRAFAAALKPYRPNGDLKIEQGLPACQVAATDMPSVDIRWTGSRKPAHLHFYFGCDMAKRRAMADALRRAPEQLPIAGLIGKR